MTKPQVIKDLVRQSVGLLELCYQASLPGASRPCALGTTTSHTLALQHLELIRFCASPEAKNALVLANLVEAVAVERQLSTLLVPTKVSPPFFATTLLLLRAGIAPWELANLSWTKTVFQSLTGAASTVASAPLLVLRSTTLAISWRTLLSIPGNRTNYRLITDADGPDTVLELKTLSCAFGLPITIVSTSHRPPQGG